MALRGKDLETFSRNKIDKIKKFIKESWVDDKGRCNAHNFYEAYQHLIDSACGDIRKDFLTGTTFYRDDYDKVVPIENDLDTLKSYAMSCGLSPSKIQSHLARRIKMLEPRWLIDIPEWDQVDRIRTICLSTEIENLSPTCFYEHMLSWGSGIFARAADPYYQNKVMILRGKQGIGKDFFVKTICKALGPYVGTWTNSQKEKDIIEIMERSLVLNVPEFDNTHQNEIAMLKALITKYQATFRTPYDRKASSKELRTSFISSANVEYLLRDSTGNRRYLIFVILKFGLMDNFDEFDSMQILAQFKWAFENKFQVHPDHVAAMVSYIESQTPQPIEDQIFEFWNAEVKTTKAMLGSSDGWVSAHALRDVFAAIKKEFGFGRNHLSILLHNRGCRDRRANGTYYSCAQTLSVVRHFNND